MSGLRHSSTTGEFQSLLDDFASALVGSIDGVVLLGASGGPENTLFGGWQHKPRPTASCSRATATTR
jgi:hypothetical protein